MKLGIIDVNVKTRHTKLGNPPYDTMFKCSQPSKDNPILNELMVYMLNGTNTIRVDSGDVFAEFLPLIYPPELEVKETTDTASSESSLDLYLEFDDSGQISTKIYDRLQF